MGILSTVAILLVLAQACLAQFTISLGGSTAQAKLVELLMVDARNLVSKKPAYAGSTFPYGEVGSGAGRTGLITTRIYDIGFSDVEQSPPVPHILQMPWTIGTISAFVGASIPKTLKFEACTVASILLGRITNWNQINKKLYGTITPIVRVDASGSSQVFTGYLSVACPSVWTAGATQSISVLTPTAFKASGSGGVVSAVKAFPLAFAYLDTGIGIQNGLGEVYIGSGGSYYKAAGANFNGIDSIAHYPSSVYGDFAATTLLDLPGRFPATFYGYNFMRDSYAGTKGTLIKATSGYLQSARARGFFKNLLFIKPNAAASNLIKAGWNTIAVTSASKLSTGLPGPQ